MKRTSIKKVISKNGKAMWYLGDGLFFGRISEKKALDRISSGQCSLFATVDRDETTKTTIVD
jgi:hypothetical protein